MHPSLLRDQSFLGLTGAQFLGHFNDNLFKMVVSLVAVEADPAHAGFYLSLASALIVLPYLLLSGYAGHMADVCSKRAAMLLCKGAEIIIMGAGLLILAGFGTIEGLLAVLFLMAAHETFFSPAKYGCVPEIVAEGDITRANGVLEASRYAAVILGTVTGGLLMELWSGNRYRIGLLAIAIAIGGLLLVQRIRSLDSACGPRPWPIHPWSKLPEGLRRLGRSRTLAVAAGSITFFESLAALVLLDALLLVKLELGAGDAESSVLGGFAAVGCSVGVLLCGWISGPKIELGIMPVAGIGIATVLAVLAICADNYAVLAGLLFALGVFGGLFFLPALSWLQQATTLTEKGLVLATSNTLSMAGVLSASTGLWLLHDGMGLTPNAIFGVTAVGMTLYVLTTLALCREIRSRVLAIGRSIGHAFCGHLPATTN
jgi:acyl-[acyl-carrier-protein]-phospholipid O-acyltransferase/long-chain-fatty-acid--[acyl-carrier-protein] ligase